MKTTLIPIEPPEELVNYQFDEVLFDLAQAADYAGLYREFIKRYSVEAVIAAGAAEYASNSEEIDKFFEALRSYYKAQASIFSLPPALPLL